MKKRRILFIQIMVLLMIFTGCSAKQEEIAKRQVSEPTPMERTIDSSEVLEDSEEKVQKEYSVSEIKKQLSMSIEIYGDGLLCKIVNDSDVVLGCGPEFELERLENHEWEKVKFRDNWAFEAVSREILAHDIDSEGISLLKCFEYLEPGIYRFTKKVYFNEAIVLQSEFHLKKQIGMPKREKVFWISILVIGATLTVIIIVLLKNRIKVKEKTDV